MTILKIDNSKRSTFVSCPRKFFYQYILNIEPTNGSSALRYGTVWHAGQEAFYATIAKNGWNNGGSHITNAIQAMKKSWEDESEEKEFYQDYRTLNNCLESFMRFVDNYHADSAILEVIEPEKPFKILINPTEQEERLYHLQPFYFTGVIDLKAKLNTRPWLVEHKTTGQAITIQSQRLHRSPQMLGYVYAGKQIALSQGKIPPEGILVSIHHLSAYKSKKTGTYGSPKIDFMRVPNMFRDSDLVNYRQSLCYDVADIQRCYQKETWPMRYDSCYTYGKCSFANLCEQGRQPGTEILEGYKERPVWDVSKDMKESEVVIAIS